MHDDQALQCAEILAQLRVLAQCTWHAQAEANDQWTEGHDWDNEHLAWASSVDTFLHQMHQQLTERIQIGYKLEKPK